MVEKMDQLIMSVRLASGDFESRDFSEMPVDVIRAFADALIKVGRKAAMKPAAIRAKGGPGR